MGEDWNICLNYCLTFIIKYIIFRWAQTCHFYNSLLRIPTRSYHWSDGGDNSVWTGVCWLHISSSFSPPPHCLWSSPRSSDHSSSQEILQPGTSRHWLWDTERSQAEIISSSSWGPCPSLGRPRSRSSPWGRPRPSSGPSCPPWAPW